MVFSVRSLRMKSPLLVVGSYEDGSSRRSRKRGRLPRRRNMPSGLRPVCRQKKFRIGRSSERESNARSASADEDPSGYAVAPMDTKHGHHRSSLDLSTGGPRFYKRDD